MFSSYWAAIAIGLIAGVMRWSVMLFVVVAAAVVLVVEVVPSDFDFSTHYTRLIGLNGFSECVSVCTSHVWIWWHFIRLFVLNFVCRIFYLDGIVIGLIFAGNFTWFHLSLFFLHFHFINSECVLHYWSTASLIFCCCCCCFSYLCLYLFVLMSSHKRNWMESKANDAVVAKGNRKTHRPRTKEMRSAFTMLDSLVESHSNTYLGIIYTLFGNSIFIIIPALPFFLRLPFVLLLFAFVDVFFCICFLFSSFESSYTLFFLLKTGCVR